MIGKQRPESNLNTSLNFRAESPATLAHHLDLSVGNNPISVPIMQDLLAKVREYSISTNSPYFMNQLFSGVAPEVLLGESVLAELKTTMATYEVSPVFSLIENKTIKELGRLFGWQSANTDGVVVPGGSSGNFMAVHCARQSKLPEYRKTGLSQGQRYFIFTSIESHYSLRKACVVLGFGENALIQVDCDSHGRMSPTDLEKKIKLVLNQGGIPLLVNATAGTTVLGAFDPISSISEITKKYGTWLHVDSAWGGAAIFSPRLRHLFNGSEFADSISFDAHKLLGASLTCGFFLTQHPRVLIEANDVSGGDYLFHQEEPVWDLGKKSWQCGRSPEAFLFWLMWKIKGSSGFANLIENLLFLRDETVGWIKKESRLELVSEPHFLNICVRVKPPVDTLDETTNRDWSKKVRSVLKSKNIAFVNFASDDQGTFLRLILANPELKFSHIRTILTEALKVR